MDRLVLVFLGLFCFLYGLFAVTTIGVVWGKEILGFSALIAGILCLFRGVALYRVGP